MPSALRTPLALALALVTAACAGTPTATAPSRWPPRQTPVDIDALVAALAEETAALRGLPFTRAVPVAVETPEVITAHLRQELAEDREELARERAIGVALGTLPATIDLAEVLARFVGAEAQGYYDPDSGRLVLTTEEARHLGTPGPAGLEARTTVVHELTHALQHQHFEGRVSPTRAAPPLSDQARARLALLEGDATLVGMEWAARRGGRRLLGTDELPGRLQRWADGAQVLTEIDAPPYVIDAQELPYEAGVLAVGAMHRLGGWARVNSALRDLDLRAAEVLHPEREDVAYITLPPTEDPGLASRGLQRVLTRTLGELELRLYLRLVLRDARAAPLAAHWRGDVLSLYDGPGGLAARWIVVCDDAAGARAVAEALAPLTARWSREGCPGVLGGAPGRCPGAITAEGPRVVLSRGA
ncbi:MAG: hypothetical protein HY909_28605 [Deltaproteobacteria bacterium]|nr:hypothetical protein [Deltaproteobacteria bacterium]